MIFRNEIIDLRLFHFENVLMVDENWIKSK